MSATRVYDPTVDASAIERYKLAYMMQFFVQNKRRFKFPKIRLQDLFHRIISDPDGTPICDIIARILRYLKHDRQVSISTADSALDSFVQEKRTNFRVNIQRIKSSAKSIQELKPEFRARLLENIIECICDDFPDLFNFDFKKTDGCEDDDECMIVKAGHDSQGCSYYYMDDLRLYRERPQNSIISEWDVVVGPSRDQWEAFIQSLSTEGEEYDLRTFLSESLLDFVTTSLVSGDSLTAPNPELDSDYIRNKEAIELNLWNSSSQSSISNNKTPIKEEVNPMVPNNNVQEFSSNVNAVKSEPTSDQSNNGTSSLNNNTVQSNCSNQQPVNNGGTTPQPPDLNTSISSNGPASVGSKPGTPGQAVATSVLTSPSMNSAANMAPAQSPKNSSQVIHHLSAPNSVNPVLSTNPGTPGVSQPPISRPGSVPQLTPPQMNVGTPPQTSTSGNMMPQPPNQSQVVSQASVNSAPQPRGNHQVVMDCNQPQQQHQAWSQQHQTPPHGQYMPGQHPNMMPGPGFPQQGPSRGYPPNQVLVFTTEMLNEAAKECPRQNVHIAHYHQQHPLVKQFLSEQHKHHSLMESGGPWPHSLMHKAGGESAHMTQEQLENRKAKMAELERIQQSMKKSQPMPSMPPGQPPASMMQYAHLDAGPPMEPGQTQQQYNDAKQEWLRLRNEFVKEKEKDEIMRIRMQGGVPQMPPNEPPYGPYHPGRGGQYPNYPGMAHPHHAGAAPMHPGMPRRMHPMMMDGMQMPAQKRPYPGGPMPSSGPYHYPGGAPGRGPSGEIVMQPQRMPVPGSPYDGMPCAPGDPNMMGCMPGPMPSSGPPGPIPGGRPNPTSSVASTTTTTTKSGNSGTSKSTKRRKLSKAQQQAQAAAAAAAAQNTNSAAKLEPVPIPVDGVNPGGPLGYMMPAGMENPEHTITRQYNTAFQDHLPECAKMPQGGPPMMPAPNHNGPAFKQQQPPNSLPPQSSSTPDFSRASSNNLLNRPNSQPGHAFPPGPSPHHQQHNNNSSNPLNHPSSGSAPGNLPYTNSTATTSSSASNSKMSQNLTSASLASLARLSNQMGAPVGPFNNLQEPQTASGAGNNSATQHHHPVPVQQGGHPSVNSSQHSHLPHQQQPQPSIQVNNTFVNAQLNVQQMNYQHVNGPAGVTSQMQIQQHVHQQSGASASNQQASSNYSANQTSSGQPVTSNQNTPTSGAVVSSNSSSAVSYGNASVQIQTKTPHTIQYMPADPQQQHMTSGNSMMNNSVAPRMSNKMMEPGSAYPPMQGQPGVPPNPYGGPNSGMQDVMDPAMSAQRNKYYNQGQQPNQRMVMMELPPGSAGYGSMPPNSNVSDSKCYPSNTPSNVGAGPNHAVQMMQQGQMIQTGQPVPMQQQQQFQMQYSMTAGAASMQMQQQQMRTQTGSYPMEWPPHDMSQPQYEACYSQQQQFYQSSGPRPAAMQPGMGRQGGGPVAGYPVSGHPNAMM